jgi:hypothetical protein
VNALHHLASYSRGIKSHLFPLLVDKEPKIRAQVAVVLLGYGDHPEARDILLKMGTAADVETRVAALEAFAAWGDASCFDMAEKALQAPHPLVRKAAVQAVSKIDPRRSRDLLISALGDDDQSVQGAATESLAKMGRSIAPHIVEALGDPALEAGALKTLAQLPVSSLFSDIRTYVNEKAARSATYAELARKLVSHSDFSQYILGLAGDFCTAGDRFIRRSRCNGGGD